MKKFTILLITILFLTSCSTKVPVEPQAELPIQKGTLRIGTYNPDTLNPLYTNNNTNLAMLKLIFEPLIYCDNTQTPIPILATSWEASESSDVWVITLRDNVTFHDGTPLTAADVVFSLNSAKALTSFAANLSNVFGVEEISSTQIRVTLKSPQAAFINMLEIPIIKASDNFSPIGTGPYRYDTQTSNKYISLLANNSYWGGPVNIANIEAYILPDKNTAPFAYEANEIEVISSESISSGKYINDNCTPYNSLNFNYIGINTEKIGSNIRKALALSINKKTLYETLLLSQATMTETYMNPEWTTDVTGYLYNPETAKELLENEQYALTLIVNKDNESRCEVADFIAESAQSSGFKITVKKIAWEDYIEAIETSSYDLYLGEILMAPDLDPSPLFKEPDEYMATLLSLVKVSPEYYANLQAQYIETLPFISLYYDKPVLITKSRIKGEITPLRGNIYYNIHNWQLD